MQEEGYHLRALAIQVASNLPGHSETSKAAFDAALMAIHGPREAMELLRLAREACDVAGEPLGGAGAEALRRAESLAVWVFGGSAKLEGAAASPLIALHTATRQ